MGSVSSIFDKGYVLIEAGRCTGGDDPNLVGRWVYAVALVDAEGGQLHDYIGTDREAADIAAVSLARDFGIRIIDKSKGEPK